MKYIQTNNNFSVELNESKPKQVRIYLFLKTKQENEMVRKRMQEIRDGIGIICTVKDETVTTQFKGKSYEITKYTINCPYVEGDFEKMGSQLFIVKDTIIKSGILDYALLTFGIGTESFKGAKNKTRYKSVEIEETNEQYFMRCVEQYEKEKEKMFSTFYHTLNKEEGLTLDEVVPFEFQKDYEGYAFTRNENERLMKERNNYVRETNRANKTYRCRMDYNKKEENIIKAAQKKSGKELKEIFLGACKNIVENGIVIADKKVVADADKDITSELKTAEAIYFLNRIYDKYSQASEAINKASTKMHIEWKKYNKVTFTPNFELMEDFFGDTITEIENSKCFPISVGNNETIAWLVQKIINCATTNPSNIGQIKGYGYENEMSYIETLQNQIRHFVETQMIK